MALKITFRHELYCGESISEKDLPKLKKQLARSPLASDLYVLASAVNPANQLEFYHSRLLAQPYYRKQPPTIIGIAGSYQEAMQLVVRIYEDCLKARGDCLLREFVS